MRFEPCPECDSPDTEEIAYYDEDTAEVLIGMVETTVYVPPAREFACADCDYTWLVTEDEPDFPETAPDYNEN